MKKARIKTVSGICAECDHESESIIALHCFENERRPICWQCLDRSEKLIRTRRDWRRQSLRSPAPTRIAAPADSAVTKTNRRAH